MSDGHGPAHYASRRDLFYRLAEEYDFVMIVGGQFWGLRITRRSAHIYGNLTQTGYEKKYAYTHPVIALEALTSFARDDNPRKEPFGWHRAEVKGKAERRR